MHRFERLEIFHGETEVRVKRQGALPCGARFLPMVLVCGDKTDVVLCARVVWFQGDRMFKRFDGPVEISKVRIGKPESVPRRHMFGKPIHDLLEVVCREVMGIGAKFKNRQFVPGFEIRRRASQETLERFTDIFGLIERQQDADVMTQKLYVRRFTVDGVLVSLMRLVGMAFYFIKLSKRIKRRSGCWVQLERALKRLTRFRVILVDGIQTAKVIP